MLLAFDLAYNGATGWVLWSDRQPDPVLEYGQFTPKYKSTKDVGERAKSVVVELKSCLLDVISCVNVDYMAYEYTDWSRNLSGKGKNWKVEYAIERQAQSTLGMAVATFLLTASQVIDLDKVIGIGANEAKNEFGAQRKDAAAQLFCQEYRRFEIVDAGDGKGWGKDYLFGNKSDGFVAMQDTLLGQYVPNHVSDAFVIAKVVSARLRVQEMIEA